MRRVGDEILATEAASQIANNHTLTSTQIRQANTSAAGLHKVFAAVEQKKLGKLVRLFLIEDRQVFHSFFSFITRRKVLAQIAIQLHTLDGRCALEGLLLLAIPTV